MEEIVVLIGGTKKRIAEATHYDKESDSAELESATLQGEQPPKPSERTFVPGIPTKPMAPSQRWQRDTRGKHLCLLRISSHLKETFQHSVEKQTRSSQIRLNLLGSFTEGTPHEMMACCLILEPPN